MKHVVSLGQAGMQDQHTYKILVLKKMRFPKLQVFVPFGKKCRFAKKTCVSIVSWFVLEICAVFAPFCTVLDRFSADLCRFVFPHLSGPGEGC